jgi:hypothetical protein
LAARPPAEVVAHEGRLALKRVERKSGKNNGKAVHRSEHMYTEVAYFENLGWKDQEIATALGVIPRRIRQIRAAYARSRIKIPGSTVLEEVHPEMAPFTAEAFIAFFEEYNQDGYKAPKHAYSWIDAFIAHRNLLLNVPPRHAKSTFFSTWVPIWLICRDRNVQIILVSDTKDFAKEWAAEIAGQLESNVRILEDLGRFAPDNKGDFAWRPSAGTFAVLGRTRHARGAQLTVQSRGMEQQILGMEADYVICDDPTNAEKAASEVEHKAEMEHLRRQVFTRIEGLTKEGSGGRALVVGQRVHPKDMYGELESQVYERGPLKGRQFWHVEKHAAVKTWPEDNDGVADVLWPEQWPFEELMVSYERVGGFEAFECMYQQNPSPEGTAIIRPEWFDQCKDRSRDGYVGIKDQSVIGISRVLSIDPSPDNFHGIIVADLLWSREQFYCVLVEVKRMRSGVRDLIEEVKRCAGMYDLDYLVFEQSTFSKWFFEDPYFLESKHSFKTVKHKTAINKNDSQYGIQSLASDFEYNRISMPFGDPDGVKMTELLGKEALAYPFGDTDDMMMALWFIKYNYRRLKPHDHVWNRGEIGNGWSWMEQLQREARGRARVG